MTQADRIKKAVGDFGITAKAKLGGGGQPEDQLRNPIEQLFKALEPECLSSGTVTLIGEKSLSDLRTRPDFAVEVNKALVGFIEVKAPGKGADPRKWKTAPEAASRPAPTSRRSAPRPSSARPSSPPADRRPQVNLRVPVATVWDWEQFRRSPDAPARTLLGMVDADPKAALALIERMAG